MDSIIDRARAKRERLAAEIERIDAWLAMADELASDSSSEHTSKAAPARKEGTSQRSAGEAMTATYEATERALNEHGAPIPLGDLLAIVRAAGVEVGGKNPNATLSARLSNSDKFTSHRGLGWWFSDRPVPDTRRYGSLLNEAGDEPAKEASPASVTNNERATDAASIVDPFA